ncbi:MAG: hypothetical protein LBL98_08155 [Ruminococcus sp.]|jgi:hypothetical protein|nr:hypothetical protein [Ruminococcus sp.]
MEETIIQAEEAVTSNEDFYRERYEALLAGVVPDALEDALTLARARVTDETDIKAAIAAVLETYPVMKAKTGAYSTGIKTGRVTPQVSGVEAAFIAKNPGIKL